MDIKEILKVCDHTLLRQTASIRDITRLCDEGIKYAVAAVCIPPCHVAGSRRYVGEALKICTVIGFPNGYSTTSVKALEAKDAIDAGADEIDMVANLTMIKDGLFDLVRDDIVKVKKACGNHTLKVIIESSLLTEEEKRNMCVIVSDSGADFIKTSTGFVAGGATIKDVELLRKHCLPHVKIKASGGIDSLKDAEELVNAGADRLGSSRLIKLAIDLYGLETT